MEMRVQESTKAFPHKLTLAIVLLTPDVMMMEAINETIKVVRGQSKVDVDVVMVDHALHPRINFTAHIVGGIGTL